MTFDKMKSDNFTQCFVLNVHTTYEPESAPQALELCDSFVSLFFHSFFEQSIGIIQKELANKKEERSWSRRRG